MRIKKGRQEMFENIKSYARNWPYLPYLWRPICWFKGHDICKLDVPYGCKYDRLCVRCYKFFVRKAGKK